MEAENGFEQSWYLPGRSHIFRQEILLYTCRFSGHPAAGVILLWTDALWASVSAEE